MDCPRASSETMNWVLSPEVTLRVAGYGLRVSGYGFQVRGYGVAGCGLQVAGCKLTAEALRPLDL